MTDLETLLAAKSRSDERKYAAKHILLRQMMNARPDDFTIDSDDGRGIVGVTHRPTGFRFHMPKQKVKPGIEKMAGRFTSIAEKLKGKLPTIDSIQKHLGRATDELAKRPALEENLRRALSYRLMDVRNVGKNMRAGQIIGGAGGALTGAVTGAPGGDGGWADHASGAAVGALTGGLAGRAGGRYLPRAAQKGVGRVLTNLMDPVSYNDAHHFEALKSYSVKEMLRSVLTDTPISKTRAPSGVPLPNEWQKDAPRSAMFRDYFNLPRRAGTRSVFTQIGVDDSGGKIVKHNPSTAAGREELRGVEEEIVRSVSRRGEGSRHMQKDKPTLVNTGAMANFHVQPDGSWEDTWDFARNGNEKIDSVANLLRALVTPFGTPSTIVGKTLAQDQAIARAGQFARSSLHDSFGPYYR